jgi:hypothetical protein
MESSSHSGVELRKATELLEIALSALRSEVNRTKAVGPERVGTMGPLTCSAEALTMFLHTGDVNAVPLYFSSFQEVLAALLRGEIDRALVPHCHPIASELLFDPRFEIDSARAFDKPNPPLHLASNPSTPFPPSNVSLCAALPTLWPLVSEFSPSKLELLPVVSNPAAAKALREGLATYAITNEASLAAYELRSVLTLKHVTVRWFPVRLAGEHSAPPRNEQ